jgi:hypothetical protein
MTLRDRIVRTLVGLSILTGCGYGPRAIQCREPLPEQTIERIRAIGLTDVINRMDVICVADTRASCRNDVAACTPWIGSDLQRGRTIVLHGVSLHKALAHEAVHWLTWEDGGCPSHDGSCFDADLVEWLGED